jgi:hypothetical protein
MPRDRDQDKPLTDQGVLIDWDYNASGIWIVSRRLSTAYDGVTEVLDVDTKLTNGLEQITVTNQMDLKSPSISSQLSEELKAWNDVGAQLFGPKSDPIGDEDSVVRAFWSKGWELAVRVKGELGPDWRVYCRRTMSH